MFAEISEMQQDAIDAVTAYNNHGQRLSRNGPFGPGGCSVFREFIMRGALTEPVSVVGDSHGFFGWCTFQTARKKVPALIEHGFLICDQCVPAKRATRTYQAHVPKLAQEALRRKKVWDNLSCIASAELTDYGDDYVNVNQWVERVLGFTRQEWVSISLTRVL
jgi:hypothetical protein